MRECLIVRMLPAPYPLTLVEGHLRLARKWQRVAPWFLLLLPPRAQLPWLWGLVEQCLAAQAFQTVVWSRQDILCWKGQHCISYGKGEESRLFAVRCGHDNVRGDYIYSFSTWISTAAPATGSSSYVLWPCVHMLPQIHLCFSFSTMASLADAIINSCLHICSNFSQSCYCMILSHVTTSILAARGTFIMRALGPFNFLESSEFLVFQNPTKHSSWSLELSVYVQSPAFLSHHLFFLLPPGQQAVTSQPLSLLFEHSKATPATGPFYMLSLLLGKLCAWILAGSAPSHQHRYHHLRGASLTIAAPVLPPLVVFLS